VGLKVDSSFLKFVTMGAVGTRRVQDLMAGAGLKPIELERYSRSNKIWSTKVKRLRLPDLLCLITGLRVEVRAKSKLALTLSDAENHPARRWNSGLNPRDMIAFVHVREEAQAIIPSEHAQLFWVEDLEATEDQSRLGPPKSASEGAERDREWPSIVANSDGVLVRAVCDKFTARLVSGRSQTYGLRGKTLYLAPGEEFLVDAQFLAGIPRRKATFPNPSKNRWDPRQLLKSRSAIDRYVAVKALGFIGNEADITAIEKIAQDDEEGRVSLEAAVALVRLGSGRGLHFVRETINNPKIDYLRMEAVLALSECRDAPLASECAEVLKECARNKTFVGNEVRQAAIWGLGKDGLRSYGDLMDFLDLENTEELVHATCAFGSDIGVDTTDALLSIITDAANSERRRASASFILSKIVPTDIMVPRLVANSNHPEQNVRNWILATLGQMNPRDVRSYLKNANLAAQLRPLQLTSAETNWTRSDRAVDILTFVQKQTIQGVVAT
jgi:hypothetical protein